MGEEAHGRALQDPLTLWGLRKEVLAHREGLENGELGPPTGGSPWTPAWLRQSNGVNVLRAARQLLDTCPGAALSNTHPGGDSEQLTVISRER